MKTDTITIDIHVRWWVRHFIRFAIIYYEMTGRKIEYDKMTSFAVRYGMRLKEKKDALVVRL